MLHATKATHQEEVRRPCTKASYGPYLHCHLIIITSAQKLLVYAAKKLDDGHQVLDFAWIAYNLRQFVGRYCRQLLHVWESPLRSFRQRNGCAPTLHQGHLCTMCN